MNDEQFTQILRAINNLREDMNRRWDINDKRWEENDKKIDKLDKKVDKLEQKVDKLEQKVDKLEQKVDKLEQKVDKHYKEMRCAFDAYENSIENMYQDNKKRIIVLEKRLKVVNA